MKNIFPFLAVAFGFATTTMHAQSAFITEADQIPSMKSSRLIEMAESFSDDQIVNYKTAPVSGSLEFWSAAISNNLSVPLYAVKWTSPLHGTLPVKIKEVIPSIKTSNSGKNNLLRRFNAQQLPYNEPALLNNSVLVYRF